MAGWVDYQSSSGASAGAGSGSQFDASGFVVNFGNGSTVGTAKGGPLIPSWAYIAAAVVAAVWLMRRR